MHAASQLMDSPSWVPNIFVRKKVKQDLRPQIAGSVDTKRDDIGQKTTRKITSLSDFSAILLFTVALLFVDVDKQEGRTEWNLLLYLLMNT